MCEAGAATGAGADAGVAWAGWLELAGQGVLGHSRKAKYKETLIMFASNN